MESDDGADGEGVTAASGGATRRASKRNDAQGGSAPPARIVTQPGNPTQADDFVPPQLECGASKLDETCPELMEHLRPVATFCPAGKLELIVVIRTFVTNTKPRSGRAAIDLSLDLAKSKTGAAGHRVSRVAGIIREMDTGVIMTPAHQSLFSEPADADAISDDASHFGVSGASLNRALAWAWVVCGEQTEVSANRAQVTQLLITDRTFH